MSQFRFHNYQRPLSSFDENLRLMGLVHGSVYSGFDEMSVVSGNTLGFAHTHTALKHTTQAGAAAAPRSVVVSQQGVIVMEDASINLNVDYNVGNGSFRRDIVIMTHAFLDSVGGSNAVYSVIKGPLGSSVEPALTNPNNQVKIGTLIIQPGAANHTLTVWERSESKGLGGVGVFTKFSESDVMSKPGAYFRDANAYVKSGFYYLYSNPSNVPALAGQTDWFLIVNANGSKINQLIQAAGNGKVYSRAWNGSAWSSWISLNNTDVEANVTALSAAIGNRLYTENNYIVDSETLTLSIDKLDIALKDLNDALTVAQTDINNIEAALPDMLSDIAFLQTYVGTLNYDFNRVATDGESLTASVNKLDSAFRELNGANNLNDFFVGQFILLAAPINAPMGFFKNPAYPCFLFCNYDKTTGAIEQMITVPGGLGRPRHYYRSFNGTIWSSWGLINYPEVASNYSIVKKVVDIGDWNMDSTSTKAVPHGLINHARILSISVTIFDDAGAPFDFLHQATTGASNFRPSGFISNIDATNISLFRQPSTDSGWFDNTSFDLTPFNRGVVTIEYFIP